VRGFFASVSVVAVSAMTASAPTFANVERRDTTARCIEERRSPPPPPAPKASACPRDPEKSPPSPARGNVRFPAAKGSPTLDVEIARTANEHERGLMYRKSLRAEQGMIFSFEGERIRTFWMKNTCIPLDMLFLARDGTVVGVLEQVPVLNEEPRSVHCAASYVLEVNAGWSRAHGVTPGMKAALDL
jgi:uncharacterized membrane protein (UPF0127 family)